MKDIVISPIFYMGSKRKSVNKGLTDLFPANINTFVDLFAGSCIVSMNVSANRYIINDVNKHLCQLYDMFKRSTADKIIQHIETQVKNFGLAKERTERNKFKDIDTINKYKNAYIAFREQYNKAEYPSVMDMYTLSIFAFSQQLRFNNKGQFNMPCGNDCFSEKNKQYIHNGCEFFSKNNVYLSNKDFTSLKIEKLTDADFVYLDPPYLNTTATYNENDGWNSVCEQRLYMLCEGLHKQGVKFGLSNVFENKGIKNQGLIDWCDKCGWNVYNFDKLTYSACGKGNSNAKEVFITNY